MRIGLIGVGRIGAFHAQTLTARFGPPSPAHLFGSDQLGRDMLSRVIWGSRVSLGVGFASVVITIVIGTAIGIAAGYGGGWIDAALMRLVDIFISIPVHGVGFHGGLSTAT